MNLILVALAPVVIIALYVYFRDKYEKEPIRLLIKALIAGCIITVPVIFVERYFTSVKPPLSQIGDAFYTAFLVAAFTEEVFKYLVFIILIWQNKNFNKKFDGIVYAVFISLGFAAVENIMYVFNLGMNTGYIRAVVSVPGHAIFGIAMGYYFGLAKFYPSQRNLLLIRSFLYPILLHGVFDFILMSGHKILLLGFIPFVIFLYIDGLKRMKNLSDRSIFR
ncbi:MAG: PrsW family intramembrane metalloprotease [Bacteroidales bacterium]|nr:PrsW family intramembrane metalloprotease [Bacteroidales bacterium]